MNLLHSKRAIQFRTFASSILHPYHYYQDKYQNTFLNNNHFSNNYDLSCNVDRVIYCFWTDNNKMSENRQKCLQTLINHSGVTVKLITPKELSSYVKKDSPLHPAYQHLSAVHKADYLRCYFMHNYGGGYCDIKTIYHSWNKAFDKLDSSKAFFIGYPEIGWYGAAFQNINNQDLANDLKTYWRLLAGNGAYIFRPHTPFTEEWFQELNNRLDFYYPSLLEHPATDPWGKDNGYPIPWANILGNIFHPLCLKYHNNILFSKRIKPSFENYR